MKHRSIIITGLALALTLACGSAQAQLGGLKKKPSGGGGGGADLAAQQDKLLKEFSIGGALMAEGMALTIEALGSKAAADEFRAQAKDLKGDKPAKTKADCERGHAVCANGANQIDDLIAKAGALSDDQKKKVRESLLPFGGGLAVDAGLIALSVETAKQAQEEVKSNPTAAAKFAPAIYVASILPGDVKTAGQTLGNYVKLAQKNGIEVPADVSKATSGVQ